MGEIFLNILNMGMTASWLMLAVMVLRFCFKKAPKWIACLMWLLVAVRLICPFTIESAMSLIPNRELVPRQVITGQTFMEDAEVPVVDAPVDGHLEDTHFEGASAPAKDGSHVMEVLGYIWLTGIVLMLLYSVVSYYRLYRHVRAAIPFMGKASGIEVSGEIGLPAGGWSALGIHDIFQCDAVDTPFILGIIKPRIYLPSNLKEAHTEYVAAHEMAHIKRRDHWWKPLGFFILSVYWFHPLCWISYILFCRDIEMACDEQVVKAMGLESKKAYAKALLSCSVKQKSVTACPLAFGEVGVKERIKSILTYKKPAFWVVVISIAACIITAACFLTNPAEEDTGEISTESVDETESDIKQETDREKAISENGVDMAEYASDPPVEFIREWAEAFVNRDGETIAHMATKEFREELGYDLLMGSEGQYSFGFSSPWPWDSEQGYSIYTFDENHAEILYYAQTSDPHITCWKETVTYEEDGAGFVMTGSKLKYFDYIASLAEFQEAYPDLIDGTMMDYTSNGLGEALNNNASAADHHPVYDALLEPESAAVFLLNLLDNPNKVKLTLLPQEENGMVGLDITFLEDGGTVRISMLQPYGPNGIWVPVNYRGDSAS